MYEVHEFESPQTTSHSVAEVLEECALRLGNTPKAKSLLHFAATLRESGHAVFTARHALNLDVIYDEWAGENFHHRFEKYLADLSGGARAMPEEMDDFIEAIAALAASEQKAA